MTGPVFVFLMGAFSTLLFPQFYSEQLGGRIVLQKLAAIGFAGVGANWLVNATPAEPNSEICELIELVGPSWSSEDLLGEQIPCAHSR